MRVFPLVVCVLAACATPPAEPTHLDTVPVRAPLPAGSTIVVEVEGGAGTLLPLLREGLEQSERFHFATEKQPAVATVVVRSDSSPEGAGLTATLLRPGQPPLSLAGVRTRSQTEAIDGLCSRVRTALGEPAAAVVSSIPVSRAYSADPETIRLTEEAAAELRAGEVLLARDLLGSALRRDAGCPVTGTLLAGVLVETGDPTKSGETARRFLALTARATPTTRHRLQRIILLGANDQAALVPLADRFLATRPHDPEGSLTKALGLCFTGRFGDALPILSALATLLPGSASVRYFQAWSLLATGDPTATLATLRSIAGSMPSAKLALPQAYALFALGRLRDVDDLLARLGRETPPGGAARLELLVMRSSVALLEARGDADLREAGDRLLAAVDRLRTRAGQPAAARAQALAELGEVLVHVGRSEDLAKSLATFGDDPTLRDELKAALTYLHALAGIRRDGQPRAAAVASLSGSGRVAWAAALVAEFQRAAGDVAAELAERDRVVGADPTPFHQMLLAQAAEKAGEAEAAASTRRGVIVQLEPLDLRRLDRHPLAHPGHAIAWRDAKARR